jgi:hypothetical protein
MDGLDCSLNGPTLIQWLSPGPAWPLPTPKQTSNQAHTLCKAWFFFFNINLNSMCYVNFTKFLCLNLFLYSNSHQGAAVFVGFWCFKNRTDEIMRSFRVRHYDWMFAIHTSLFFFIRWGSKSWENIYFGDLTINFI